MLSLVSRSMLERGKGDCCFKLSVELIKAWSTNAALRGVWGNFLIVM